MRIELGAGITETKVRGGAQTATPGGLATGPSLEESVCLAPGPPGPFSFCFSFPFPFLPGHGSGYDPQQQLTQAPPCDHQK